MPSDMAGTQMHELTKVQVKTWSIYRSYCRGRLEADWPILDRPYTRQEAALLITYHKECLSEQQEQIRRGKQATA